MQLCNVIKHSVQLFTFCKRYNIKFYIIVQNTIYDKDAVRLTFLSFNEI